MSAPDGSNRGWEGRVEYANDPEGGFFYRPRQIIARDGLGGRFPVKEWLDDERHITRDENDRPLYEHLYDFDGNHVYLLTGPENVLSVVAALKRDGFQAEPNYVLFASDMAGNPLYGNPLYGNPLYGNPLYGNPLYGNPLYGNPLYGNPLYGNPLYGNPLYGNPLYGNPLYGNPLYGNPFGYPMKKTGHHLNSAHSTRTPKAAPNAAAAKRAAAAKLNRGEVFIFDSGFPPDSYKKTVAGANKDPRPLLLKEKFTASKLSSKGYQLTGPNTWTENGGVDALDEDGDKALDPVAGHGTFIAGIVELLAPHHQLNEVKVFFPEGDVDIGALGAALEMEAVKAKAPDLLKYTIFNLSFSGYAQAEIDSLKGIITRLQDLGAVVVASAGNDGTWRRAYPACLPDVVSVGALGPLGPAPFTNFGPWVRACAPGTEVISTFFREWDGFAPGLSTRTEDDPDDFEGWARWSGTSFAAPVVVAALLREMDRTGCTAKEAVKAVVDAPGLLRIPGLGTVINIAWPPAED
ncbi:MAG: S8 family serine peptidase [Chloroflexi bacterium]|nr:S8 family serine peptidase [Chloroflexota bacterium]